MRLKNTADKLRVTNFDVVAGAGSTMRRHSSLLPDTVRSIVCGPSNSGKTNVLFNLLFNPNGLKFANVYVFSKSLQQPKYKFLENVLGNTKEIGYYTFSDNDSVINPSEAEPNSIMVFDDIACEKHDNIRNYFTMGRHNNIDSFYLGQTYSRIPKQLIRDNANLLVLFKQDDLNLRHIYNDHVNTDMVFSSFKTICASAWKDKHGFVVIDKDSEPEDGRYRIGFDQIVTDFGGQGCTKGLILGKNVILQDV